MLNYISDNIGFKSDIIVSSDKKLKVGIIDADLLDHGTKHPNLALMKISAFCKGYGHDVRLICSYDEVDNNCEYDVVVLSRVFKFTKIPDFINSLIEKHLIYYGGTGFFEINGPNLPDEVEHHMPDYELYSEYIEKDTGGDEKLKEKRWHDYLNYSIGFTTRGCIRHCDFCVNRLLNRVVEWSPVSEFLDENRTSIYLWDDNIMAAPPKVFAKVMDDLNKTGKSFQFRQGLDIRLMTPQKAQLLNDVNYHGDFIFAFDHYRLDDPEERKQVEQTIKGLKIWREYCKKKTKLYVLVGYDGQDVKDIEGTFYRIKILMEYGCVPYIMRFEDYEKSEFKDLYVQLARWCNQPGLFKKKSFRQFCAMDEGIHQGLKNVDYDDIMSIPKDKLKYKNYWKCFRVMLDFEKRFPEIAEKYFDLRFEDLRTDK